MRKAIFRQNLLLTTAVIASAWASVAAAQDRPVGAASAPEQQNADASDPLEEITVTATRQSSTVNRVPLSVTAQTQLNLDQKGIRTITDLQGTVPGLRQTGQEGSGIATVSIRGIVQSSATAATTGFYLDETPLQKRAASGFGSQNGTPIPPLFDLERVEVLRGPQGTLFGGGSEGGTIRYLQPQPSLTRYSIYSRSQIAATESGSASYETGVAIGGPIVQDKLGFRASVFGRNSGGYLDLTDYRNGRVYDKNANHGKIRMGRIALAWAPTPDSKITASYFASRDEAHHIGSTYNLDVPGVLTVPSLCYDVNALSALPVGSPARTTPAAFAVGPTCNGRANQPGIYVAPGYTVGPLDLDRYQSLVLGPTATKTNLRIASLDASWNFTDLLNLRSITSYTTDLTTGSQPQAFQQALVTYRINGQVYANYNEPGQPLVLIPGGITVNPNITATPNGLGLGAYLQPTARNHRRAWTQELRLSSTGTGPVSFVAGAFFSDSRLDVSQYALVAEQGFVQMSGLNIQQRFGVPNPGYFAALLESDKDVEIAGFGEINLRFGSHFRATGGVRVTHVKTDFDQSNFGPNGFNVAPSLADGSRVIGSIKDTPVTPKVSLQYAFTPDQLIYATAAKGFRAGGVNKSFSSAGQGQLFGQYGLTKSIIPVTYASDSVWSYELGGKLRLFGGRAQVNGALYRIDWSDVQTTVTIGGDGFVANVPTARSQGAELEMQVRPFKALTLDSAISYGTSKYTSTFKYAGARGLDLFVAQDGQRFAQPPWTVNVGARFDADLSSSVHSYFRTDVRWFNAYDLSRPGAPGYTPDSNRVPARTIVNLRLGVDFKDIDINLFVNNVTNEDKGELGGGRSSCTNIDCSTFNNFNVLRTVSAPVPRQIGLQIAIRR